MVLIFAYNFQDNHLLMLRRKKSFLLNAAATKKIQTLKNQIYKLKN